VSVLGLRGWNTLRPTAWVRPLGAARNARFGRHGAVALGLVALSWAGWASYNSLATLRGADVPVDWVGLAFAWTGLAFVAVGLTGWSRGGRTRFARLMALCGFLFFLPSLTVSREPILWTLGATLNSAYEPLLFYLVLAFPDDRLGGRGARVVMGAAIVSAIGWGPLIAPLSLPEDFGCTGCPASTNLFYLAGHEQLTLAVIDALARWSFVVSGSLLVVVGWRLARASPPRRRVLVPVYATALVWGSARLVQASTLFFDWIPFFTVQLIGLIALSLLPIGFALGLLRAHARRWRVGDLVLELEQTSEPRQLRAAIARALGDPSLELALWSPEQQHYTTSDGRPVELPGPGDSRAATFLEHDRQPLGVLVHDAALLHDHRLVDGVAAVARLAVMNERLAGALHARLDEVRASRARIVAATDAERQRVERNLHDGAQQRLVTLALHLRVARERLDGNPDTELAPLVEEALAELGVALAELRELAQGVHPSVLTDHGLAAALEFLAERAPLPVTVKASAERYPATLEGTAYFIAAEALTNIAKYAHASHANISVTRTNDRLTVDVTDDGTGGADPAKGSGLRGLSDRVAAVDGRLRVESQPGKGTRIHADLPCA
jgi:signal transduction histidine kinase